ncbi:hypothetical protein [Streptomyces hydrogenans]|nr:hypothetical protein [Streptomyces hydrogenans]GHG35419.1 hypothetical protein GCM10018784_56150 [Streptomyces hydrogenans]GHI20335.1 hypothetical protein Shyd_17060 [Streptomyces hydrogenans]GHI25415.1 hypothetical protein Shyd_67860 [Streptomyces hydrogenans]GHI25479.1 hypothetical protein Shyd_68500 [Streptomyces hydrogenans]GHI25551.1 hypothetical protein Shyd_69220 [Streptomyces hydrogenans]
MLEHLLARQEQYIREQVEAHDTDDFIDRLAARIGQESRRPARVAQEARSPVRVGYGGSDTVNPQAPDSTAPADPGSVSQVLPPPAGPESGTVRPRGSTRPAKPRRRRRRPAPLVVSDPEASKDAALAYVQLLCDDVLRSHDAAELADFSTTYSEIGARTFACLLYQLDCLDAALYWWRFAAGAGDPLSAHLLAAYHAAAGRGPDARAWRASARLLGFNDTHLPHPTRHGTTAAEGYVEHLPWNKILRSFMGSHHLPEGLGR